MDTETLLLGAVLVITAVSLIGLGYLLGRMHELHKQIKAERGLKWSSSPFGWRATRRGAFTNSRAFWDRHFKDK